MGSEVKKKWTKPVDFTDEDNEKKGWDNWTNPLEYQTRIRVISSRYRFADDYDPPVWDPVEDPEFELDETMVIYGQRRQGKSYLARYLLLLLRRFYPTIFVFTGTAFNNFWQQVVPASKVIDVDVDTIEGREETLNGPCMQLLELNAKRIMLWKQMKAEGKRVHGNPLTLVVSDDVVTNDTIKRCPSTTKTMLNGRHHGLASWVLPQVWKGLTPPQRKNLDRVILFAPTDMDVEEWVRDTYGVHVLEMYRRVTSVEHQAFVIVNKAAIKGPRFFKVKADKEWVDMMLSRNVVLGNERLWEGTDIKEQKKRYPYVDMAEKTKLKREFNETLGDKEEKPDDLYNVAPTPSLPPAKKRATDKKSDGFGFAGLRS